MKPGKALLIVAIIIVVLLLLAWAVSMSNKRKTAIAIGNQKPADANVLGRHIAVASLSTDYTLIDQSTGKAVWTWAGTNPCPKGYGKIESGPDKGWCKLLSNSNV